MRISVCLASYNGASFIEQQITSILTNLSAADELIISDDGSTDGTLALIQTIKDPRITLLNGPKQGLVCNFENAILNSSGDVIFLADQDDIWVSDKVTRMLDVLVSGYDLVISDCNVIDENGAELHASFYQLNGSAPGLLKNLLKNSYLGCAMAFKREFISKALPFPAKAPMHDWWLGMVAESFGSVKLMPDKLMSYRRHGKNASPTGEKSANSLKVKLNYRLNLLAELVKRFFKLNRLKNK
ncbi:MAG: glycosyltransferase family 2 protein [Paraglaciecola sp.]|nr:glycosyltransferase family 2 protein [Paraglaciecola sp.]